MNEKTNISVCSWNRPLSLPARIALCFAIGASLAVSVDLATGTAVAGGLFVALTPPENRD